MKLFFPNIRHSFYRFTPHETQVFPCCLTTRQKFSIFLTFSTVIICHFVIQLKAKANVLQVENFWKKN